MFGPASAATHAPAGDAVPGLPTVPGAVTINPARPAPGFVDTLRAFAEGPFAYDNNVRIRDEGMPDLLGLGGGPPLLEPREIAVPADAIWQRNAPAMAPVEVFEDENVKVTAILVDHPPGFPAYAFRFDTPDGSIVFSGDTTASPNLIKLAQGADVLVHEVIHFGYREWLGQSLVQQGGSPERLISHLTGAHTSDRSVARTGTRPAITGVGTVARRAGVRHLVLNHLVPTVDLSQDGRWFDIPAPEWHRHPAREFDGPVTVGSDLLTVRVRRAAGHGRGSVNTAVSSTT
jgi:hypothetical protein